MGSERGRKKTGTAESESSVGESASTFTGGGHGRLENNNPNNKSLFVLISSWRLNSLFTIVLNHIFMHSEVQR